MKQSKGISPLIIVGFVGLIVAVAVLGWIISAPSGPPKIAAVPPPPKSAPADSTKSTAPAPTPKADAAPAQPPPPAPEMAENRPKTPEEAAREAADIKIGTLIAEGATPEAVRDKLLLLFPNFTAYEKIAAAPHIVNLTGDEDLPRMLPFLKNPNTPPEAMESFFNDMLNRPPQLGWSVLVDLIGTQRHPMAERAKEIMTTIVGEDHGNDVGKWMTGLRQQLQQQGLDLPDPNAPQQPAPVVPQE
jgi:hypothetical protein